MTELEVVKFIVMKPGSQQEVASFNTTVRLTDNYFTLPPFRRYLSEQHVNSHHYPKDPADKWVICCTVLKTGHQGDS